MAGKTPFLKFCGCRSKEDLLLVKESRADLAGFIFAPSKRRVAPEDAGKWVRGNQPLKQQLTGVFVNPSLDEIQAALANVPLDIVQCHGDETPDFLKELKKKTGITIWKALRHEPGGWNNLKEFAGVADGYVIDARVEGAYGGTGTAFDWDAVPMYLQEAERQGVPCFIAGGIHAENISKLLSYSPDGIDISSGIEEDGKKSRKKIKDLEGMMMQYENSIS
ncbi:phosphoribosylanthranilate isomerase [Fictibacillus sp. KU28468]|uniref:phosphoribosylanthranilate isomerase n=1 Tax=Fictibacillus sp. KU28468 TaxID=2991053 RepID=UPI00223DD149|nr:phosphoribosylanthranilate isomerase [Fictibacillus sp. KU28468]UZJ80837.1 phosphoribosylanthranilate isomerase [Fictibacillus sp. KU28468]